MFCLVEQIFVNLEVFFTTNSLGTWICLRHDGQYLPDRATDGITMACVPAWIAFVEFSVESYSDVRNDGQILTEFCRTKEGKLTHVNCFLEWQRFLLPKPNLLRLLFFNKECCHFLRNAEEMSTRFLMSSLSINQNRSTKRTKVLSWTFEKQRILCKCNLLKCLKSFSCFSFFLPGLHCLQDRQRSPNARVSLLPRAVEQSHLRQKPKRENPPAISDNVWGESKISSHQTPRRKYWLRSENAYWVVNDKYSDMIEASGITVWLLLGVPQESISCVEPGWGARSLGRAETCMHGRCLVVPVELCWFIQLEITGRKGCMRALRFFERVKGTLVRGVLPFKSFSSSEMFLLRTLVYVCFCVTTRLCRSAPSGHGLDEQFTCPLGAFVITLPNW